MPLSALAARRLAAQKPPIDSQGSKPDDQSLPVADPQPDVHSDTSSSPSTNDLLHSKKRKRPSNKKKLFLRDRRATTSDSDQVRVTHQADVLKNQEGDTHKKAALLQSAELQRYPKQLSGLQEPVILNEEVVDAREPAFYNSDDGSYLSSGRPSPGTRDIRDSSGITLSTASRIEVSHETSRTIANLECGEILVILGSYEIQVNRGSVSLLGAVLHASPRRYRVKAPTSHSIPAIRALQHPKSATPTPAEISISSVQDGFEGLSRLNPAFNRTLSGVENTYQVLVDASDDPLRRPIEVFLENASWQTTAHQIIASNALSAKAPKIAMCGPKNSGKSSFARFITNVLLSTSGSGKVMFMDLDPGQPEFALPGDVTLSSLEDFNFGPSYSHSSGLEDQYQIVRIHHYGCLTPRDDPELYISCARDLHNHYRELFSMYPLVVNFSGWILGRGLDVLESILGFIAPENVLYMSNTGPNDIVQRLQRRAHDTNSQFLTLDSHTIESVKRSPADLRIMQSLSYFHARKQQSGVAWDVNALVSQPESRWKYSSTASLIDAVAIYQDGFDSRFLEMFVCNSVLAVVVVENDSSVELALKHETALQESETDASNWWRDTRTRDMVPTESHPSTDPDPEPECDRRLFRSRSGLPYLSSVNDTYLPFDPSKSSTIGHTYVRGIDENKSELLVSSPVGVDALKALRRSGRRIILVHGRTGSSEWALLEPYHLGVDQSKLKQSSTNKAGQEKSTNGVGFNMVTWAKETPRVQLVRKSDVAARKRFRPWKLRRNLEFSIMK